MTSAIPQVAGINSALKMIENNGGKKGYFDLYLDRNLKIRKGVEYLGLSTFPQKGFESPTVTCVNAPEDVQGPKIYEEMRELGFELAQGYGSLKERTFRIGNMGYMPDKDIYLMLEALDITLQKLI